MERKKLVHRISRVQGQLESLKKLLEQDVACEEVLRQSKTCKMAMESFSKAFLVVMMRECLLEKSGRSDKKLQEELSGQFETMLKHL